MTGFEKLSDIFPQDAIERRDNLSGSIFEVKHDRGSFGGETLLIRFLEQEPQYQDLLESDILELESQFYDEETSNQWNIQLFWVYDQRNAPPESIRRELEIDTRFAIRRCVPLETLEDFVAPLETSYKKIEDISNQFDRSNLIGRIIDHDLGFLFEDTSRPEKLEKIKSEITQSGEKSSPEITSGDPIRDFVDSVQLGDFRENSNVDNLDMELFTLVYGLNGTGKTSLLDGITLGMVGQIRREDGRADDYDGLGVTLEGYSEPLPIDSTAVNNRVAEWFGFRPHGPAKKHVEFYRVNYLEAGSATRLIDPDPDVDIEETLRRFLFGEELTDARKDKEWLLKELEKGISDNEEQIMSLESEVQDIQEKQERFNAIFSKLDVSSNNLSPAAEIILGHKQSVSDRNTEQPHETDRLEKWATWAQRFSRLRECMDALPDVEKKPKSAAELQRELTTSVDQYGDDLEEIESVKTLQTKRARLENLGDHFESTIKSQQPASVALAGLILSSKGVEPDDLVDLSKATNQIIDSGSDISDPNSVIDWRERLAQIMSKKLGELNEQMEKIEEISQLEERRRQLEDEIRRETEEYLSITEDVHHCPACYLEQDRKAILNREKPEQLHSDEAEEFPDSLQNRISEFERGLDVLESSRWGDIDYDISVRFEDLCGLDEFIRLWDICRVSADPSTLLSDATAEEVETFAYALRELSPISSNDLPAAEAIDSAIDGLNSEIESLTTKISDFGVSTADVHRLEEAYRDRIEALETGLQILDEHWPDDALHQRLDVQADHRIMQKTLDDIEADPSIMNTSSDFQSNIDTKKSRIDELHNENSRYRDRVKRLKSAFEGAGGEEKLEELVEDHMTVISTLFKAFQRPYEFESVDLEEDCVVVTRRDEEGTIPMGFMSSGQRAALALAIFVTNNLAHNTAPPLMMLDEPFAHLDDVNTISFFNLLIDLAEREERQIIFATASKDIADLLRRKVGDSPQFSREDLPPTKLTVD